MKNLLTRIILKDMAEQEKVKLEREFEESRDIHYSQLRKSYLKNLNDNRVLMVLGGIDDEARKVLDEEAEKAFNSQI